MYMHCFLWFLKHPEMNEPLFDCLQHDLSSEQELLFIHPKFGNIKNAEKTELHTVATRISKVSRRADGLAGSLVSRCLLPSMPKNSRRERTVEPVTMPRLARFHPFF